jgi:hypothetical protein
MNIPWYKKVLKENRTEIYYSATLSFVVSLGYLSWSHFQGSVFMWQSISPIEQPSIFVRVFYSALAFVVPGYLLYIAGFYKYLHKVIVMGLRDKQLYRWIKALIWICLMLIMYEVFKIIVDIMNVVISFFYNIFNLILYLSPTIGIFAILCVVLGYIFIKVRK